jgi:hypothetical protein
VGRRGPKLETSEPREIAAFRLAASEVAAIDRVRHARGDRYPAETVRALPLIWSERESLLRAALGPMRGRYSRAEIELVIDAMDGTHLPAGMPDTSILGQHVAANVADIPGLGPKWECAAGDLARRLDSEPAVARVALELWCAWLWSRAGDGPLWECERAWLDA